jgi:hypothetical protein
MSSVLKLDALMFIPQKSSTFSSTHASWQQNFVEEGRFTAPMSTTSQTYGQAIGMRPSAPKAIPS